VFNGTFAHVTTREIAPLGLNLRGAFFDHPAAGKPSVIRQYTMPKTLSGVLFILLLAALIGGGDASAAESITPLQRVASTPKGQLKNPYTDFTSVAEEGQRIYRSFDCNGCHGGGGGGGMAAPLTNPVWIYGDDDDTLFRLITLGTGSLSPGGAFQKQGFVRRGSENVVGPMPPYGDIIKTEDDIWKIIAWIRSKNCERDAASCR
jgi:mono/diheme cytochrome c family protein